MKKTIEIPEGYEARIEGNKVILERKSEDEWIRKHIIKILDNLAPCHWDGNEKARCIAYLERQKEQQPLSTEEIELNSIAFLEQMGYTCIPPREEQEQPEVDLEEEIDKYFTLWRQGASDEGCVNANSQFVSIYDCYRIARHFYKLGLNARKEE